jgi:hypothetical protein
MFVTADKHFYGFMLRLPDRPSNHGACCTYLGALCHIVSLIPFKHVAQFELPIWIGATPAYKYREGISKDIPQE